MPGREPPAFKPHGGGYCPTPCRPVPLAGADWLYLADIGAVLLMVALLLVIVVALGRALDDHDTRS